MKPLFTQDFFIGNRARLRQAYGSDMPIVLTANGLMQRNADNVYSFRQDSNFWYVTGIDHPDIILVIDGSEEFLIVPARDAVLETFEGRINLEELSAVSGVTTVINEAEGWQRLGKMIKKVKKIAGLTPSATYLDFYQFYTNPARARLVERLQAYNGTIVINDLRERFAQLRVVKQAPELEAIRRATDVTVDGLLYVTSPKRFSAYTYEYEVEADITREFRRRGSGHTFDPIVASGSRGVQMHATQNAGPLSQNEMVILDVGAEVNWYAADVARTIIATEPSKRQREIYDAVYEAQEYAFSLIKPGVIHKEYEADNERFVGEKLKQLGIISDLDRQTIRKHFPHMMSHFVGLEPHDVGDYSQAMQVGSVMVVEPGMYSYKEGLGVRLEDMVVITEDGYELLSSRLPRSLH